MDLFSSFNIVDVGVSLAPNYNDNFSFRTDLQYLGEGNQLGDFWNTGFQRFGYQTVLHEARLSVKASIIETHFYRIFKPTAMKIKASLSPSNRKAESQGLPIENIQNRLKSYNAVPREDHLSPAGLKLAKQKSKPKKENKPKKKEEAVQGKKTKRKETKRYQGDLNSTVLMNEGTESKKHIQSIGKLKTKSSLKGLLKSNARQNQAKKSSRCDWFNGFMLDSTVEINAKDSKKKESSTKLKIPLPKEDYLFIGDQFYEVGNFCPTKRFLNTLREHCSSSLDLNTKFVPQDKIEKPLQAKKKVNIFLEARREIQLKTKTQKAIIIQKWWRRVLHLKNLNNPRSNPQHVSDHSNREEKISFHDSRESEEAMKSPFEFDHFNQSPVLDRNEKQLMNDESIIASFNSAEFMQERQPKKIEFTKQNISNLLNDSYKLPETPQINSQQNEQIFNDYSKFRMKQAPSTETARNGEEQTHSYVQNIHQTQNYNINFCRPTEETETKINQSQFNLLREFEEATKVKEMIEVRVVEQKGQLKHNQQYTSKVGISTSILATHSFLVKFFNFYIQQYREEFVSLVNMPFGYSVSARLSHLSGRPLPEEEEEDEEGVIFGLKDIVDSQKIEEYYEYARSKEPKANGFFNANIQIEKIHNRAVIDYFNEEINQYRPYSQINGVPYPWNHSYKALTFYFVTQENIAQIFQKVQITILKSCSLLCGIHIDRQSQHPPAAQEDNFDLIDFMEGYEQNTHGLILEHNEEKQLKHLHEQVKKQSFEFDNEIFTGVLLEVSGVIFQELATEITFELWNQLKKDIY